MKKVLLFVTLLTLLFSSSAVLGAPSADRESLDSSIRIREQLGFNTTISDVQIVNSNFVYQKTKNIYGIALTDEEVAEMNTRDVLIGEASDLENTIYPELNKNPSSSEKAMYHEEWKKIFAGVFLDNLDNGTIKVGIVDLKLNGHVAEQMLKSFSLPDRVKFFNARINKEELSNIQDELTPLFSEFPITESSVSLKDNKVFVGLSDLSFSKLIDNRLSDFAREHIDYVLAPNRPEPFNTRTTASFKLRGGLGIDTPSGTPGYVNVCSSAFNARKEQSNGSYYYYVITAAHCGALNTPWSQGGDYFGTAAYRKYGGQADMLAIQIVNSNKASAQIQNTDTDFVDIKEYEANHIVGTYVCIAGRNNTLPTCGTIIDNNFSTSYQNGAIQFSNMVKVDNNQTSGGDSGGAVYARISNEPASKRGIYGVLSGGVANDWYFYSKAGRVFSDLGMTQILTSSVSFP